MKHILLLAIICLISRSAIAQPTLTAATNNPVAGDVIVPHICDTNGYSGVIAGGASGAGVTWNFGSLVTIQTDTISFISAAGTLYIDSFPGSNLLDINRYFTGHTQYLYYTANTNYWGTSGNYDSNTYDFATYYQQPYKFLNYPASYGAPFTTDTCIQIDSTTTYHTTYIDSDIVDAYGTLITPAGTYANVLRVHRIEYEKDSSQSTYRTSRNDQYYWYQSGVHFYLLAMEYDTSAGTKHLGATYYSTQIATGPNAINPINKNNISLEVNPNPAADFIDLKFTVTDLSSTSITLSDITGKIVGTVSNAQLTAGLNEIQYPVPGLPAGVYVIRISSDGGSEVKKIVVER